MKLTTTTDVNLREGPSEDSRIFDTIPKGTEVEAGDWAWRHVELPDGRTGFMAHEFLTPPEIPADKPLNHPVNQSGLIFDPNFPTEKQIQSWTCSIRSCMWMLGSIGIKVTAGEMQDSMVPHYVNATLGLLDASGAGVVKYLSDYWAIDARNVSPVEYKDVYDLAGEYPIMIGGRNWGGPALGHWVAVRGKDPVSGSLILANPASGDTYGQLVLTPRQFAEKGWFSMVHIPL